MRTSLVLVLSVAACVKANPVTPEKTTLFEWDNSKSSRVGFRAASVGPRTAKDVKVTITNGDAPFVIDVHIETSTVNFTEGTAMVHQTAPVKFSATVKSNPAWELSGSCQDGPNYKMPSVGSDGGLVTPDGMMQDCIVKYHRVGGLVFKDEWSLGTTISVEGDGKVTLFPAPDGTVE